MSKRHATLNRISFYKSLLIEVSFVFLLKFLCSLHLNVQESEIELTSLRLDEANKLAQELSDRKMELKAAMFNDKLASFVAFTVMDEVTLGELAFSRIQIPFKSRIQDLANTELIGIRDEYDFVLPLEHGQRIVGFKWHRETSLFTKEKSFMRMSCFGQLGRLIGSANLKHYVERQNVAQCDPNQFVVCHDFDSPKLSVFNSSLQCLRTVDCKKFSNICCNSKFVFGLWNTYESFNSDNEEPEEDEYSSHRIQARHVDTLSKAFELVAPEKYTMKRIMADEHRVVAISRLDSEPREWFMSVFYLAACNESGEDKRTTRRGRSAASKYFLAKRHIRLDTDSVLLYNGFLFDGWLVFPGEKSELIWFDRNGIRSEVRTKLDSENCRDIYSFGSGLIFTQHGSTILMRRNI